MSNTSKHTPGPWFVFTKPDGSNVIGIGDRDAEGVADCGFGIWRGGSEEAHANARLISAAPDLYTQLVGAVAMADVIVSHLGIDVDETSIQISAGGGAVAIVQLSTLLANARAAIAKAEGR